MCHLVTLAHIPHWVFFVPNLKKIITTEFLKTFLIWSKNEKHLQIVMEKEIWDIIQIKSKTFVILFFYKATFLLQKF